MSRKVFVHIFPKLERLFNALASHNHRVVSQIYTEPIALKFAASLCEYINYTYHAITYIIAAESLLFRGWWAEILSYHFAQLTVIYITRRFILHDSRMQTYTSRVKAAILIEKVCAAS